MNESRQALAALRQEVRLQKWLLLGPLAVMWGLQVGNTLTGGQLNALGGIHPRSAAGLPGILFAPLLHDGVFHLLGNSISWLVLGWLVLAIGTRDYARAALVAWLVGGLGTWIFGQPGTVHVGASGVIFGFLGYVLARGWYRRTFGSIALALLVGVGQLGMLFGMLPGQRGISWEGHLFGFLGGALAAWLSQRAPKPGK